MVSAHRCGRRALGADLALRQIGEKEIVRCQTNAIGHYDSATDSWTLQRVSFLHSVAGKRALGAGLVFGHIGENEIATTRSLQ